MGLALAPVPCPRARRVARCLRAPPKPWRCPVEVGGSVRQKSDKKFGESERVSEKVKEDEIIQEEDKWLTYLSQTNSKHSPRGGIH